ncbi:MULTISPECIES: SurA N-terminal domain-containing protein [Streptomyces]|uniref:Lipoprotein n=1 Tax=Streptomyces lycii TaxID=2654337 RepID=A0ABQ7FMC9_9ACTN|nr:MULTISPECIES: SurA N-terminal domain-containing protein [Streptomyces]KAF4409788.1 hypothetical protein GCU69_07240 [Streptomyces lycii]PGH49997.1 hypothetical protein CRI70_14485 [Streptomyces sp. Ru87]
MHRRRTALAVTAAAVVLATPLLTACGNDAHPGAAAVVDGDRITVSQVQDQVRDVRTAQNETEDAEQLVAGTGRLSRATLNNMIFEKVLARAAKDAGVGVSRADIQQTRETAERAAGGADRLEQMWLQQYAIGPGRLDATLRNQVLMEKLSQKLGVDRSSPQGQQQLIEALKTASEDMGIDVNPRFGSWDAEKVALGEIKEPWLREQKAAEEPA